MNVKREFDYTNI